MHKIQYASYYHTKDRIQMLLSLGDMVVRTFPPPKMFLVYQDGGFAGDDAGRLLERNNVDRKTEPTDLHASMVERHNVLIRKLLHTIEGQTILEGLPTTNEDIVSLACYAKNSMLEIGETHPIPAVRGMRPYVLPDVESSTFSSTDDMLGPENSVGRRSVRLREI